MTEIPEHLLKRSRDRRAALGLGGDAGAAAGSESGGETPAVTPATTASAAATPAAAAPAGPVGRKAAAAAPAAPPPKPDPPYVVAAKTRNKVPFWAMAALALLPLWAFMYVRSLTTPPVEAAGPIGIGAEVFSASCSSCHGATGEGGSGRPLHDGEVTLTFPHIEDQLRFVYFGTEQYNLANVAIYGNPDRPGGAHTTGSFGGAMPGWGSSAGGALTDEEILSAVCHERYDLGGPDRTQPPWKTEFDDWCADDAPFFVAVEGGTALADLDTAGIVDAAGKPIPIIDIGTAPVPGSA